ncbi:DUF6286 domain-containing protein [Mycolicibacterium sp.]|uniref:DUF6286 domain-containing protein n=1 Tax=Mycolicibacterium sp. TaxID=2320850 RepID=UPI001A35AFDA|nr:DUF6286 domain-containing protein [Mycolicibacterium sp.]MBJ7338822.1 hypothetical protein [Mycolicibacterium sp.]
MTLAENQDTPASATSVTPAAGRPPVAAPAAGYVGAVIALLLLAAGAVALRDAAVGWGWLRGTPWVTTAISGLDGLTYQGWMPAAGVAAVVVGLWFVSAALRPRRRTALAVPAQTSVWIPRADLARLAATAAGTVPGVLDAKASASLRTVGITADVTAGADTALKSAIGDAVADVLHGVTATTPRIKVRVRTGRP